MRRQGVSPAALVLAGLLLVAACSGEADESSPPTTVVTTEVARATAAAPSTTGVRSELDERYDLPPGARVSNGGGGPRPPAYWAVWNTCAPENRAAQAAASGGVLLDDVLADPGIALGDHRLTTCEESVALLQGRTGAGEETADPAYALAAQLLAAELNLNVGAETCPVAEEAVVGAHIVLSGASFDGKSATPLDAEAGGALPDLVELLTLYNAGDLCL